MLNLTESKKEFIKQIVTSTSKLSKDPSTKVGAVAFGDLKDLRVLSIGYNGFAKGYKDDYEKMSREEKNIRTVHAEINLICNASYNGVSLKDSTVVITKPPCPPCLSALINAGVSMIVAPSFSGDCSFFKRWRDKLIISQDILNLCEIIYINFKFDEEIP